MGEEGRREMCGFEGHGYVLCTIVHSSTDPLLFSRVTEEPDTPLFTVYCSYLSTANVATLQKNTKLQNNNMHHYTVHYTPNMCALLFGEFGKARDSFTLGLCFLTQCTHVLVYTMELTD